VAVKPVLSLNRGFSAPIRVKSNGGPADNIFLMKHDGDNFNRWEAGQTAGGALILGALKPVREKKKLPDASAYCDALRSVLTDRSLDPAFQALMLTLPSETDLATLIGQDVDPGLIHEARDRMRGVIGKALMPELLTLWDKTEDGGPYRPDTAGTARRSLRYAVLQAIAGGDAKKGAELAMVQFARPPSMTDEIGAISTLVLLDMPARDEALDQFYSRHKDDHLLVDKWFALQASVPLHSTAERVRRLMRHPEFKLTTPNRVRGLVGTFAMGNPNGFHAPDGEGYRVLADTITALDALNPQVAARIATAFRSWATLEKSRRGMAQAELERILAKPGLSRDSFEIISKSLKAATP
jgi:aminopeptidase N